MSESESTITNNTPTRIIVLVLLVGILGAFIYTNRDNQQESVVQKSPSSATTPKPSIKTIKTSNTTLYIAKNSTGIKNPKNDGNGWEITGDKEVDIIISLAKSSTIQILQDNKRTQKAVVTIHKIPYIVTVFGNPNGSTGDPCNTVNPCTAFDKKMILNHVSIDTYRLWVRKEKVLEMNPQGIIISNIYTVPYLTITKKDASAFKVDQIKLWDKLLGNMQIVSATK